jgi:hypothetical protein
MIECERFDDVAIKCWIDEIGKAIGESMIGEREVNPRVLSDKIFCLSNSEMNKFLGAQFNEVDSNFYQLLFDALFRLAFCACIAKEKSIELVHCSEYRQGWSLMSKQIPEVVRSVILKGECYGKSKVRARKSG